jgi:tripartite-type tricarboxylate transporter receptor subunit TctC
MKSTRRALLKGMAVLPMVGLPSFAWSKDYPGGPITMIVPFPPGGGTDASSRLMSQGISANTGWNIIIENRAGAGGNIGLGMVARARPDGMTIGMAQTSNLAINPTLYPTMPYDATKDFAPIMLVAAQPVVLVVSAQSPYKTLKDLVDAAHAKPGALAMASAGIGTVSHLAGAMFGQVADFKFLHVPYPGAAPAITNMLGDHVQFYFGTPPSVLPLVRSGKLRALAVTSALPMKAIPEVPSIAQSGYEGYVAEDWKGLVAPAGTPQAVIDVLNMVANKALQRPDSQARLADEGSTSKGGTAQAFADFLKVEQVRWGKSVRDSGAKME